MADRTVKVRLELLAQMFKRSAAECGKAVKDVDQALDKVDGRSVDVDTKPAQRGLNALQAEVTKSTAKILAMKAAFRESGDVGILRDLRKEEMNLRRTSTWLQRIGDDSDDSGRKLGVFGRVGVSAGKGMSAYASATADASGVLKLALHPVGLMAIALGGTAAASVAASAAVGGFGLGIAGLGAIALRNNEKVKASFLSLGATVDGVGERSAKVLEGTFVRSLSRLGTTAISVEPSLREMFVNVRPGVDALSVGIDGLVRNSMPGLVDMSEGANKVMVSLGDELPEVGAAFSRLGSALSTAAGDGKVLVQTLDLLETGLDLTGGSLVTLGKAGEVATLGMNNLGGVMEMVQGEQRGVAARMVTDITKISTAYRSLEDAARGAADASLGIFSASLRGSEALRALSKSLQENGRSFTLGTEAGNNNRAALEGVGLAARAVRDNAIAAAEAQGRHSTAAAEGARAQYEYASSLRVMLTNAKFSKEAIDSLFAAIGLIPPVVPVNVQEKGAADAKAKIIDAAKPRSSTITARSSVNAAEVTLTRTARPRTSQVTAKSSVNAAESALNRTARPRTAVISATASANAAEARLNAAARSRTATIYVRTVGSANAMERSVGSTGGEVGSLPVKKFAYGGFTGLVSGPGTTTSDSILAALSRKEYVVKASSVERIGLPAMEFMNRTGTVPAVASATRPSWDGAQMQPAQTPNFDVRVFVGDREIHDIVRVEVGAYDREAGRKLAHGRR